MLSNGIKEKTATTGAGTITLSAVTGFARFSDIATGHPASYAIKDGNNWEWGIGTVGASNTLARTVITARLVAGTYTSSGATAITLASGNAEVICTEHTGTAVTTHLFSQFEKKTVANTITETTLMGGGHGSITVPAYYFIERGYGLHLMAMGSWSKGATSNLTLRIKITQGVTTTTHHQKIFSSARLGSSTTGHWNVTAMFNAYTIGTTGSMMMHGMLQLLENDSAEILGLHSETPEFTLDTTLPFDLFITAEWSAASALNTIHSSNVMIMP